MQIQLYLRLLHSARNQYNLLFRSLLEQKQPICFLSEYFIFIISPYKFEHLMSCTSSNWETRRFPSARVTAGYVQIRLSNYFLHSAENILTVYFLQSFLEQKHLIYHLRSNSLNIRIKWKSWCSSHPDTCETRRLPSVLVMLVHLFMTFHQKNTLFALCLLHFKVYISSILP